jgi:UDP:flavonoid glycosyltransferase YjiC (YdhE family)
VARAISVGLDAVGPEFQPTCATTRFSLVALGNLLVGRRPRVGWILGALRVVARRALDRLGRVAYSGRPMHDATEASSTPLARSRLHLEALVEDMPSSGALPTWSHAVASPVAPSFPRRPPENDQTAADPIRILFSCFGSGGDLFPLVSVARELVRAGHTVLFVCPRTLGLYLRALGFATVGLGKGAEMKVLRDEAMFTTAFGGWKSWHYTWDRYVAFDLEAGAATVRETIASFRPDVAVTTSFAAAARIEALRAGIPHLALSMYPQHFALTQVDLGGFGEHFRTLAAELAGQRLLTSWGSALVFWGIDSATIWMHDRVLLRDAPDPLGTEPIGYPYWDSAALGSAEELKAAVAWLQESDELTILITQGSFVGHRGFDQWAEAAEATARLGVRAILVGARSQWATEMLADRTDLFCTAYLPLSTLLPYVSTGAHHGGLGTSLAFAQAALPAVVQPQAYDQPFNADLLSSRGIGIDDTSSGLEKALSRLLRSTTYRRLTAEAAEEIKPAHLAVRHIVNRIVTSARSGYSQTAPII